MKLFIPRIWTRLQLTQDWTVKLIPESRNLDTFERLWFSAASISKRTGKVSEYVRLHDKDNYETIILKDCPSFQEIRKHTREQEVDSSDVSQYIVWQDHLVIDLPQGTNLNVDRIYIKKWSYSDYDSVTFWASHPDFWKKKLRFWASLEDVNTMEVLVLEAPDK